MNKSMKILQDYNFKKNIIIKKKLKKKKLLKNRKKKELLFNLIGNYNFYISNKELKVEDGDNQGNKI
jgi:hypothetical protein